MRDIDIVTKAMQDAQAELSDYIKPAPRDPQAVLQRMLRYWIAMNVVAAQQRLRVSYGQLRVIK
ncbi:hypothetical protein [Tardiphaga sp. 709]|uniref:hypothetical protein n=1 Tax=Tardiphaga sp. 709 TaxID=3076039 RepID=UPI0028EE329B|nr:hypothetical protein [Tardiphaga sp. 709]WNV10076.1 hypothetical protein RSO67_02445 [Tardiphaga sp. 709]